MGITVCKKYYICCLIIHLNILFCPCLGAAELWVSPGGSDKNPGTKDKPFASVSFAIRKARELRRLNDPTIAGGIHIILRGGTYQLQEPIFVRPEDSGTECSPTWVEAAQGERPVISGGITVKGWKRTVTSVAGLSQKAKGKIWEAPAPQEGDQVVDFRQLWVNGQKAVRARDVNGPDMKRILSWNHADESCWIPAPDARSIHAVKGMEMFIHQWWAIAILRIKSIEFKGDSARLTFFQPESRIQSEHPWPAPWISKKTGNSAFYLSNALEFLDRPGEWYLDKGKHKIYYWPERGVRMTEASVVAPVLETLVKMKGTVDHPISYFRFKGLSFEHSSWLRPSKAGHVPLQAGMYLVDAYKLKSPGTLEKKTLENQAWVGRPAAAVEVAFSTCTGFQSCRFQHLASTGLDYQRGNYRDSIAGNLFKDIGGSAILTGVFSDESFEAHRAYHPTDLREVSSEVDIRNNLITDVTNEDWGCVGIGAGFVKGISIVHNEINNVSYSGISLGWGWTSDINVMSNNKVLANKIHHYGGQMYDVAGIYTLSAQPGSLIAENYIDSIYHAPYAHDPHHWFYLYCDEGSSYFSVKNNWCPASKFLQNANGPGNTWEDNGPMVADSIRNRAGLTSSYRYLLNENVGSGSDINTIDRYTGEGTPGAIEVTFVAGGRPDLQSIIEICRQYAISASSVYEWNNHLVIFDDFLSNPDKIKEKLLLLKNVVVKVYSDLIYEFHGKSMCSGKAISKEWNHIVMRTNLAEKASSEDAYVNDLQRMLKNRPQIISIFCDSDYQRLLLFKSGKELLMIVSIPKGASLKLLNTETKDNNPMKEWTDLMKKYQKGMTGSRAGEIWTELKKCE